MNIYNFKNINIIKNKKISFGENIIYSAGFNVDRGLESKERIDEEIEDLKFLIKRFARIFIVSHQGSYKKKSTYHLNFIIPYLKKKLKCKIIYLRKNIFNKNLLEKKIKPGEILFLPNSRLNSGEEKNSIKLGKSYSKIADSIVVGGFSKAHRKNSTNNSILKFKPGYLSSGVCKQVQSLYKWSSKRNYKSVCILGGAKEEKIKIGLNYLTSKYYKVIPGGIVLNTILKQLGYVTGRSIIGDKYSQKVVDKILKKYKKKIFIPDHVYVSNSNFKYEIKKKLSKKNKNDIIVGYEFNLKLKKILKTALISNGQILIAGTPSFYKKKFFHPTKEISKFVKKKLNNVVVLGGDSVNELKLNCNRSSGGGSALYFISGMKLPIIDALEKNRKIFV